MRERDPYRDERDSLAAENERLRRALAEARDRGRSRAMRVLLGVALAAANLGAFVTLPALLNARDDGRVYTGAALALLVIVLDLVFATRVAFPRPPEPP
jgi:hypothetical protein